MGAIVIAELMSLLSFVYAPFEILFFIAFTVGIFILALKRFDVALTAALVELILGSKDGRLFAIDAGGANLSLRMMFFIVLISVWLVKHRARLISPIPTPFRRWFVLLGAAWCVAFIKGVFSPHLLSNVFFDANGYVYFLYLPLFFSTFVSRPHLTHLFETLVAVIAWVAAKTLFFFFYFSHRVHVFDSTFYHWIRQSGVGEVTPFEGAPGLVRVFFQSHLFVFLGLLFLILFLKKQRAAKVTIVTLAAYGLVLLFGASALISLSRSLWLGSVVGIVLAAVVLFVPLGWSIRMLQPLMRSVLIAVVGGAAVVTSLYYVPFPQLPERAPLYRILVGRLESGEPAISSRMLLLGPLIEEVRSHWLVGAGFGKTITYETKDPRIVQETGGRVTTYAFEWGWLDLWLKMGILGFIGMVGLLLSVIRAAWRSLRSAARRAPETLAWPLWALAGTCALAVVHIFTPYLNHPLGIGALGLLMLATRQSLKF